MVEIIAPAVLRQWQGRQRNDMLPLKWTVEKEKLLEPRREQIFMPHKTRYPVKKMVEIVKKCMEGKISRNGAAKKYEVSRNALTTWERVYKQYGTEGPYVL